LNNKCHSKKNLYLILIGTMNKLPLLESIHYTIILYKMKLKCMMSRIKEYFWRKCRFLDLACRTCISVLKLQYYQESWKLQNMQINALKTVSIKLVAELLQWLNLMPTKIWAKFWTWFQKLVSRFLNLKCLNLVKHQLVIFMPSMLVNHFSQIYHKQCAAMFVLVWNLLLIMLFKSGAKQLDLLIHLLQRKKPLLLLEASLV